MKPLAAQYLAELEETRSRCIGRLYSFLRYFWPVVEKEPFVESWHIPYICDAIQPAIERVLRREARQYDIVINVPPGTSKSTIFSVMLPAWVWVHDPTLRIISGSYDFGLATHLAIKSRDILKSEDFKTFFPNRIDFKSDKDGKTAFDNTRAGGRKAVTVGSSFIGFHAHLIIIDDGQDPEAAESPAKIEKVKNWIDNLSTRMVDKEVTLTIYIQQRLSENDISSYVLEKGGCLHICLPAEVTDLDNVKPPEVKEKYVAGYLDPARLGPEVLAEVKRKVGGRKYAQQFLQYPASAQGNIFKREYWRYWKELPKTRCIQTVQSWDTAFKDKEQNDFSCCTTWKEFENGFYLIDFWMERVDSPTLKNMIIVKNSQHLPQKVLIEDKASGIVMIQELQRESRINIFGIKVERDKITRALDCIPTIEAGNVYLPEGAPWVAELIDRMAIFPDGKHDDDVDSVTQFLNWVRLSTRSMPWVASKKLAINGKF